MSRTRKSVWLVAGVAALLMLAECFGIWIPGVDMLFLFLFGWIPFLIRVVPKVHVRWELVASTGIYIIALVAGSHLFLRWLHREISRGSADTDADSYLQWRWRWTLSGFLIVVIMFTAGMAAIGVAHQTAWLATSPKPLYERSGRARDKVKCASNLRQMGQALNLYALSHGGKYPDDLGPLLSDSDLSPWTFICPRTDDAPSSAPTTQQAVEDLRKPGHCSYIYLGKGLAQATGAQRVLALEPLSNHGDGINVLYVDGSVEWKPADEARPLCKSLGVPLGEPSSAATRPD